jgi:hypothetical protein
MADSNLANAAKESAQHEFPHTLQGIRTGKIPLIKKGFSGAEVMPISQQGVQFVGSFSERRGQTAA